MVGSCAADVRIVQRPAVDHLLERFRNWAILPRNERDSAAFTLDERKLLHRIRVGQALNGKAELDGFQERIGKRDLARHRLDSARCAASTIQVDLAGLRGEGDRYSLILAAQDLLGHTVDALLAAHGDTNPNGKWRMRNLAALPADWEKELPGRSSGLSAQDLVLLLNRAPATDDVLAVLAHALRITHVSRRVFGWAEARLLSDRPPLLRSCELRARNADGPRLPHLDLDVAIRFQAERFALMRINGSGQVFRLSAEEYSLLSLFDGETSIAQAASHARKLWPRAAHRPERRVEQMMALIRHAELGARPMIDEIALSKILR
jgi:hypothetical protein